MTRLEFKNKIIALLSEFDFVTGNENLDSIFGVKWQEAMTWKDNKKNTIKSFNRSIYVSTEMYPNEERNFLYVNVYTKGEIRNYRCKIWYETELFKLHFSAKTYDLLFEHFKQNYHNILGNSFH